MPIPPVSGTTQKENHKYNKPRETHYAPDRRHNGLDYYAPRGTQVKASASGVVAFVGKFEPRERLVNVRYDKKEKRFTGAYGNVIIIYHGQNIKTQKHTCTLYSHLVDNVAMRKGSRVKEDELIGFVGNTGTRAGFDKKNSGYKLHFEVIESKNEISTWPMRLETDYGIQNQIYRKDPEKFLRSTFAVLWVGSNGSWWIDAEKAIKVASDVQLNTAPATGLPGPAGGLQDAWRHAEASKRITEEAGWLTAATAGYWHELEGMIENIWNNKPWVKDLLMDLHNNRVGRRNANTGISTMELLNNGQLMVIKGHSGGPVY